MVYLIGAIISARNQYQGLDDDDQLDGILAVKVFQAIPIADRLNTAVLSQSSILATFATDDNPLAREYDGHIPRPGGAKPCISELLPKLPKGLHRRAVTKGIERVRSTRRTAALW